MTTFCAICTDDTTTDLALVEIDGRQYTACVACRTEHPRSGRYGFNGGKGDSRGVPLRGPMSFRGKAPLV